MMPMPCSEKNSSARLFNKSATVIVVLVVCSLDAAHFKIVIDNGLLVNMLDALDGANIKGIQAIEAAGVNSFDFVLNTSSPRRRERHFQVRRPDSIARPCVWKDVIAVLVNALAAKLLFRKIIRELDTN